MHYVANYKVRLLVLQEIKLKDLEEAIKKIKLIFIITRKDSILNLNFNFNLNQIK